MSKSRASEWAITKPGVFKEESMQKSVALHRSCLQAARIKLLVPSTSSVRMISCCSSAVDSLLLEQHRPALPLTITIPPLACSQALRLHPSYARIQAQADAWLLSVVKPSRAEEAEALVQMLLPFITCAVHVDLAESLCLVAAKFMAWGFVYEDITDDVPEGLGAAQPAAHMLLKNLDTTLMLPRRRSKNIEPAASLDLPEHHRAAAAIDVSLGWWNEMRTHLSPAYQSRFRQNLRRFTAAAATQVAWRQAAIAPDLYTFIANRRSSVALYPFFTILESGLGLQLDRSVLDCHLLTLLRSAASDHAAWVNDLVSFKREYVHRGDFCNILALTWLQPSSPGYGNLQKSVEIVSKMIEQRDQDFERLLAEARDCRALMEKPGMDRYLQGMADWLAGNLHWSYATAHYYHGVDLESPRLVDAPLTIHLACND